MNINKDEKRFIRCYLWLKNNIRGIRTFSFILMLLSLIFSSPISCAVMYFIWLFSFIISISFINRTELVRHYERRERRLLYMTLKFVVGQIKDIEKSVKSISDDTTEDR